MQILECWLKHYGKFSDMRISFHAGLNIIEGGNESGKSTILSFICAMLYGIQKTRSKNLDEYQLRQPWDNPDYFAGVMKVHEGNSIYRIERNFLKKDESLRVVCETESRELENPEAFLTELTGGLSEGDFLNTFYIRQAQARTDSQLGEHLRDYLVRVEQAGSTQTDVTAAVDQLKKRHRELQAEKKQKLDKISGLVADNLQEAEFVRAEIGRLQARLRESQQDRPVTFERRLQTGFGQSAAPETDNRQEGHADGQPLAGQTAGIAPDTSWRQGSAATQSAGGEPGTGWGQSSAATQSSGGEADTGLERVPPVLPVLLAAAAVMAVLCSVFAQSGILRILLFALAGIFAVLGLLAALRIRKEELQSERSQRRLRKAERSVKRYTVLNRLLGYRDHSVDPELEARMRRLDRRREDVMREEEKRSRQEMAADVARIMADERQRRAEQPAGTEQQPTAGRRDALGQENTAQGQAAASGQHGAQGQETAALREAAAFGRNDALERELTEKQQKLVQLDEAFGKLSGEKNSLRKQDEDLDALSLAIERIQRLSGAIYRETGEEFSRRVSELLVQMTGGRYSSISLDDRMDVNINTPDRLLKISQVSFGTMNQIYFALRIAAGELLSGGKNLPLLLDEPFAMYDDERLKNALTFLAGSGRQTLLFTCQSREKLLAGKLEAL
ncbi:MAG: AAA family ATPase [Porcincola intestinalis]|uniref:ATP-binding protein n=1 Tax=Porcincola intestinalis TaxID=2606632 RepID=UPI002A90904E|nr:AAA family ATPase [Porcincola intestinalis]MDY5332890.1 AAA family ATPase [Porcincola intestinalis]